MGFYSGKLRRRWKLFREWPRGRAAAGACNGQNAVRGLDGYAPKAGRSSSPSSTGHLRGGVAAITVHGRTVQQRYVGPSSWDFLREVKRHAGDRTVLGSGDLFTPQACIDMLCYTGVDGLTVARGAIGNPWIFQQVRALLDGQPLPDPPTLHEQRQVIEEHYRLATEVYGPEACGRQMRKFGIKYSRLHPDSLAVRDAFVAVKRPHELAEVLGVSTRKICPAGIRNWKSTKRPTVKKAKSPANSAPSEFLLERWRRFQLATALKVRIVLRGTDIAPASRHRRHAPMFQRRSALESAPAPLQREVDYQAQSQHCATDHAAWLAIVASGEIAGEMSRRPW